MAVKYFCDPCGEELKDTANRGSFTVEKSKGDWPLVKVSVEVMVTINGTTNDGHICPKCVIRVVSEGLYGKATFR